MAEKLPPMSEKMKAHFKASGKTLEEYNMARRARMRKKAAGEPKPKAGPTPAPTPTETRSERAARMRASAKATPSITQEDVTRQTKARRATSGQRPTAETHGSNWQTAAGKWDRARGEAQRTVLSKERKKASAKAAPSPTPEEEKE